MAVVGPYLVSLADVRQHLRIPAGNTSDDQALQNNFIPAVTDVIRNECGDVVPTEYDEYYDGGQGSLWLRHKPVVSVSLVQEGWGYTNFNLDYVQVNATTTPSMFAYSIDNPGQGLLTRRTAGNVNIAFIPGSANIRVVYVAGRQVIPGAIKLAALELIRHWYQGSQQRAASPSGYAYDATDQTEAHSGQLAGLSSINVGIPYNVLELLKPYRRAPIIG